MIGFRLVTYGFKRLIMKTSLRWILSFIVACSLIFLFVPKHVQGERIATVAEDDRASDFSLKDLNGHHVKLSDYKGRVVLLYFMATWCRECPTMIPQLKKIHSLYSAKGLVLLNIDVRESEKKALAFSSKYNLPYPTLLDEDGKVSQGYGIFGVPVKVLINREGRIICWNCRSLDKLLEGQFNMKTK